MTAGRNVYSHIKRAFPLVEKCNDDMEFYSNKCKVIINENYLVTFLIRQVSKVTYLNIEVEGERKIKIIETLEFVQDKLLKSGIRKYYIDVISYDSISEYYCNKMLVKLNALERNLRKLLFNIYILHFEEDYYKATMNSELQNKIKGVIGTNFSKEQYREIKDMYEVNQEQAKAIVRMQQFFYSFEFMDIQKFLFIPSWTNMDEKEMTEFLSKHTNLTELSDEELRKAFEKNKPRSDWERFFSSKIHIPDIEDMIDKIRVYRNSVAHFKFFTKSDYRKCDTLSKQLNKAILEAIEITEEVDFVAKNSEDLNLVFSALSEKVSVMMKTAYESIVKFLNSESFQTMRKAVLNIVESKVIENIGHIACKFANKLEEISITTCLSENNNDDKNE